MVSMVSRIKTQRTELPIAGQPKKWCRRNQNFRRRIEVRWPKLAPGYGMERKTMNSGGPRFLGSSNFLRMFNLELFKVWVRCVLGQGGTDELLVRRIGAFSFTLLKGVLILRIGKKDVCWLLLTWSETWVYRWAAQAICQWVASSWLEAMPKAGLWVGSRPRRAPDYKLMIK